MTANDLLGRHIGPYHVESILGSGGMAVVYRAAAPQDKVVALKVLFPPPGTSTEVLTRFEREARTAARLNHPGIVRVIDVGQADGRAYMAMTLIDGESLTMRLARAGKFDEAAAADIAWQIADALYYAHGQGVVHRDVKSSNILITADDRAFLTDFGVAQALDDSSLTRTGHTVGTPAYMAPEQATGQGDVDGRADLYSLGVVLYQMVTGRVPFAGSTPKVLHAHVYDPPPPPSTVTDISPAMEAVILKALAKDIVDRYQTGAAMAQALASLDDQTSVQMPATPVSTETTTKRSSARLWLIGVVLVALAIIGGLWWFTRPTDKPAVTAISQSLNTPTTIPLTTPPTPTLTSTAPTATLADLPYPTGSLLKGSGDGVFRMHADGILQHVYDLSTFQALGFNEDDIQMVEDSVLDNLPQEELTRLLQAADESLDWVINGQRWRIGRWQPILAESGHLGLPASQTDETLLAAIPLAVVEEELPEGSLVQIGDNFYRLFTDGGLRRFITSELVEEYGYTAADFIDIPDEVSHLYRVGAPLTPLLQAEGSDDVFLITEGKRQPMPPIGDDLWALGYGNEDIQKVPAEFLENLSLVEIETPPVPPATPENATVEILPTATPCPQPVDEVLTPLLTTDLNRPLGCPRTPAVATAGAWQPFDNGLMLWREDLNLIYVIQNNTWLTPVGDTWREGDAELDPAITAPESKQQPKRGFGKVWRERPGVRGVLGWALAEESGFNATIQEFVDGLVWYDPERNVFMILFTDGAYQRIPP